MVNYENGGIVMVKVDIISGFLGAGKTTLIKHLLAHVYAGENVVLIENEFGEIGIDGGFLKEAGIEIREMNSGCICCSLVGDFATSLKEVVTRYNPDRILIEPSGVGKLSDVIKAVENVKDELELEICYKVAVIDVTKCKMYLKNFGEFYKNQIESASTVIFSRTDIAKAEKVEEALELVKSLNEEAAVITTPVQELDDEILINALKNEGAAKDLIREEECCCGHHHGHHHHHHHEDGEECCCGHHHEHGHHHHADEVFTSWGMETSKAYSKNKLEEIFTRFDNETKGTILRSKGILKSEEGDNWLYFDYVPGQFEIREGNKDYIGKVCVIAAGYTEEELKEFFV